MPVSRRSALVARATAAHLAVLLLAGCFALPRNPAPAMPIRSSGLAGSQATGPVAALHDPCGPTPAPRSSMVEIDALPTGPTFTSTADEASGRRLVLGPRVYRFEDFTPGAGTFDGAVVGSTATGLQGAGRDRTVLEVEPRTSTRAGEIPTDFPATNQLSVLRVTGRVRVLGGFTLRGTDEGHLYNGLRVDRLHGLVARDITVTAIPGDASSPPGETFGLNDYRTVGSDYARIDIDGAGVGASGFGVNGSRDIRICDSSSHDNPHSMGFAFWHVENIELIDCSARNNGRAGFNFERTSGTVRLIRPLASGNRTDMSIASDQGSADFTISDPLLTDGRWTVTLPKTYYGRPNLQHRGDVHLMVRGHRRDDLIRFRVR